MKRGQTDYNFLIAINKPSGMTSHDVVSRVRNITGEGRVGHMGTLDPLATGVMLIGIGSAARLNNYLENADKTYRVTAKFGVSTSTYDTEGEVSKVCDVDQKFMTKEFASKYLSKLVGTHMQKPPAFSAIKVDGVPSYKHARKGNDVDLSERQIEIYNVLLCDISDCSWTFELEVSSGTYIRSIVHDIGQDLGIGAHVKFLERKALGDIKIEDCLTLEQFEQKFEKNNFSVLNVTQLLAFPVVEADDKLWKRVSNGNSIRNNSDWNLFPGAKIAVEKDNKLQAIYRMEDLHTLVCECKFSGAIELPLCQDYCVTLGVFDGFHEGHIYEVNECIRDAKQRNAKSVVVTFDIDPDELFVKDFKKLASNEDRIDRLKNSGVDEVRVLNFKEIQNLTALAFLEEFFCEKPPLSLHVGKNFKFGKNQSGDTDLLLKWGVKHGVDINVHDLIKKDGEVISSTRLREEL